jgi:hypothetical protein
MYVVVVTGVVGKSWRQGHRGGRRSSQYSMENVGGPLMGRSIADCYIR